MTSGSEKRARTAHLTFRLNDEERALIEAKADAAGGLTPGSYAREILLGAPAPRPVRRRSPDRKLLAQLLGQLGKIGGNLNQLAKDRNHGLMLYENEILTALEELKAAREALLDGLGRRS